MKEQESAAAPLLPHSDSVMRFAVVVTAVFATIFLPVLLAIIATILLLVGLPIIAPILLLVRLPVLLAIIATISLPVFTPIFTSIGLAVFATILLPVSLPVLPSVFATDIMRLHLRPAEASMRHAEATATRPCMSPMSMLCPGWCCRP